MLFHQENEIVQMLPPRDATSEIYTCWVNMSQWHHGSFFCYVGRHFNNITFTFRKGQSTQLIAGNEAKNAHTRVAPMNFVRWYRNVDSDDTATTHMTVMGRPSSDNTIGSTAIMAAPSSGYSELGSKGELMLVEVDNTELGKDSQGRYYDMVQIRVGGTRSPTDPSGILGNTNNVAVWAILSEPRYGARASTGPKGTISSRTP